MSKIISMTHPEKNFTTLLLDGLQLFEVRTSLFDGLHEGVSATGDSTGFGHGVGLNCN